MYDSDWEDSDGYGHIEKRLISTAKFQLEQIPPLQDDEIKRLKKHLFQLLDDIKKKRAKTISEISNLKSRKLQMSVEIKNEKRNLQKSLLEEKRKFSVLQEEIQSSYHEEMKNVTKKYSQMQINYLPKSPEEQLKSPQHFSKPEESTPSVSKLEPSQSQTELSTLTNKVNSLLLVYEDRKEINQQNISESFCKCKKKTTKLVIKYKDSNVK